MLESHCSLTLENHRLLTVTGDDRTHFLERLITTDVEKIGVGELLPGALLSPQGKVLFDFLIGRSDTAYLIDISASLADNFMKRLNLYRMRSKVEINESPESVIRIFWQKDSATSESDSSFVDKRFPPQEKVIRTYGKKLPARPFSQTASDQWDLLRIKYGIAESGKDFNVGDVFPHDINFDETGAISYKKGCYIGQEVVSRMHHRGTIRRRMLVVEGKDNLPNAGSIECDGKTIGNLGTVIGNHASAIVRIDKVKAGIDKHIPFFVENVPVTLTIAPNMNYSFPDEVSEGE
ncbi:YgfZ/GcvT domain-containing protein [Bartonella choladocola]|uniref:CAF17 C-terminal domain-containing protein n=1 Tax=Bartonella choladocola TaxID=2750995 RepID=A0A1U9MGW0_9HYPH|nr:folate-binding protein YgfZ [Bartonella choladocola]AQT46968.1 hypothetical protein BBC0122_008420 [Bartonella choladocola]